MTWQTKKLGEICEIINGGTPKTNVTKYWDGDILWLTPKDMGKLTSFYVDYTTRKITESGLKNSSAKLIPINSVILSSRAPIGYLAINSKPITTNQGCKGLTPKHNLNVQFLFYFLKKSTDLLNSLGSGTTFKELSGTVLKEITIPFPPLSEQQRIVAILDKVFAGIEKTKENTKKNLQNAKELFESYLQSVFANLGKDWKEKKLSEVCGICSKLVDPRELDFLDLRHIGAGNIETNSGQLLNVKTAREEKLISGKFEFDATMVLYSKIRPYLMKVAKPDFKGLCSADIYPLKPDKNFLIRGFLFYLLLTQTFTDFAVRGSARAGMPKVNRDHLFNFKFFLPTIFEQKTIVNNLDNLSAKTKKLEVIYQQKLLDLEELKKSVLKKAFSGEL
jgi:type I restriction enzyme S subunit